jgi:hypothetical protein
VKWNYDLTEAPSDNRRLLALWHWEAPHRDVVRIVWLADKPHAGYRYLCDALSSAPYYIDTPHAFCLIPEIERERSGEIGKAMSINDPPSKRKRASWPKEKRSKQ